MSAMADGFDTALGYDELAELTTKKLIQEPIEGEYQITSNGSILVRNAMSKIHDLVDRSDFDDLLERIGRKSVELSLTSIRNKQDHFSAEQILKKILTFGLSNISGFIQSICVILEALKSVSVG